MRAGECAGRAGIEYGGCQLGGICEARRERGDDEAERCHLEPQRDKPAELGGLRERIFARNRLDVSQKVIQGGSTNTAALIGGDVQVVMGGGSEALSAAAGGADLVVVGVTIPKYTFVIEGQPNIKSPADLRGRTFAVGAARGSMDIAIRAALKSLGIDADREATINAVGTSQAVAAALMAGTIDAAAVQVPDTRHVEAKGTHPVMNLATADVPAASNAIYTLRSYANSHRDVVQAYVDSVIQSIARLKTDRALSEAALRKYLKLDDQGDLDATYEFFSNGVYPAIPFPKVEQFADAKALVGQDSPTVRDYDVSKLLDPSFMQSAADRGVDKKAL